MRNSILGALDRRFAEVAVAKGYLSWGDFVSARQRSGALTRSSRPRTLPGELLELGLMGSDQIDAVMVDMFRLAERN